MPFCGASDSKSKVTDTRPTTRAEHTPPPRVHHLRQRFTTYEQVERAPILL